MPDDTPLSPAVSLRDLATDPEWVIEDFVTHGFVRLILPDRDVLDRARSGILERLQAKRLGGLERLEDYHHFVDSDDLHEAIQFELSEYYWSSDTYFRLVQDNLAIFEVFLGRDLECQNYPYLRIARPDKFQDNLGFHRDSDYGTSPFEVSCFVPFTDLDDRSALRVIPGSHQASEKSYASIQALDSVVEKGSRKHKLGFPYAPKHLGAEVERHTRPVPVRVGEVLLFNTAMVHGQRLNNACHTRFSSDIRLVNAFAPINRERSVHADYYRPLCSSAVTRQARLYEDANRAPADAKTAV